MNAGLDPQHWFFDPGSGISYFQITDSQPRFLRDSNNSLGKKYRNSFSIVVESEIRDKHPGSATLLKLSLMRKCCMPYIIYWSS
jgi:hypothetical protein